jgi:hypothetical protein
MERWRYLTVLTSSVLITVLLEALRRGVHRHPRQLALSVAPVAGDTVCWSFTIPLGGLMSRDPGLYRCEWCSVRDFDPTHQLVGRVRAAGFDPVSTFPGSHPRHRARHPTPVGRNRRKATRPSLLSRWATRESAFHHA